MSGEFCAWQAIRSSGLVEAAVIERFPAPSPIDVLDAIFDGWPEHRIQLLIHSVKNPQTMFTEWDKLLSQVALPWHDDRHLLRESPFEDQWFYREFSVHGSQVVPPATMMSSKRKGRGGIRLKMKYGPLGHTQQLSKDKANVLGSRMNERLAGEDDVKFSIGVW
jgi:hypothetical protein